VHHRLTHALATFETLDLHEISFAIRLTRNPLQLPTVSTTVSTLSEQNPLLQADFPRGMENPSRPVSALVLAAISVSFVATGAVFLYISVDSFP
jgi:multisubunit Na+/H+ antiporter MnhC subunit